MSTINDYPFIKAAAMELAFDSDMINRTITEEQFLAGVEAVIFADGVYEKDVKAFENWLSALTDEDRETVAVGEHSEMMELIAGAPKTDEGTPVANLLDDIFEYDYYKNRHVGD